LQNSLQIGEAVSIPKEEVMQYFKEHQLNTIEKYQSLEEDVSEFNPIGIKLQY